MHLQLCRQRSARRVVLGESSATEKPGTAGQLVLNRDYTHLPITDERLRFEANRKKSKFECKRLCLLKNSGLTARFSSYTCRDHSLLCFFMLRSSGCDLRGWLKAKEPHQPFEILYGSRQVELFAHEPHPAQSQTTQSDLVLEFGEQRFHLLSLPSRLRELRRVGQLSCSLSCRLMDVNGEVFVASTRALRFLRACAATFGAADVGMGSIANV